MGPMISMAFQTIQILIRSTSPHNNGYPSPAQRNLIMGNVSQKGGAEFYSQAKN